jgi:hypothetical protein
MPQELTNTPSHVTVGSDAQATQEDASSVQPWEPGLKPSRMNGYSLLEARRHTRAMLSTRQLGATHKLSLPGWHKPYSEALLTTEPQTLAKFTSRLGNSVLRTHSGIRGRKRLGRKKRYKPCYRCGPGPKYLDQFKNIDRIVGGYRIQLELVLQLQQRSKRKRQAR